MFIYCRLQWVCSARARSMLTPVREEEGIVIKLIVFAKENVAVSQKLNGRFVYSDYDDIYVRRGVITIYYNSAELRSTEPIYTYTVEIEYSEVF